MCSFKIQNLLNKMFSISLFTLYVIVDCVMMLNSHVIQTQLHLSKNENNSQKFCSTDICMAESKKMLSALDDSIDPCDNFYEFACGQFIRKTILPANKNMQTTFSQIQDTVDAQLSALLMEDSDLNETNHLKLANILTKSCMDEITLNQRGYKLFQTFTQTNCNFQSFFFNFGAGILPMLEILEKYGGWPLIKGANWNSSNFNWLETSKHISNDGFFDLILNWDIGVDLKNSKKYVLIVSILMKSSKYSW